MYYDAKIGIVIPCYKVREHILNVVGAIPEWVDWIIAVDDCCPQGSGEYLTAKCAGNRLVVMHNQKNLGVGGATLAGYMKAKEVGCDIVVKMDGDGQMDSKYLRRLIHPLAIRRADYAKGNRFYHLEALKNMPLLRRIGNTGLTLLAKVASGYWRVADPTNGYTALHSSVLELMSSEQLSQRYFFETSMLIQLNIIGATVADIPMPARYGAEESSLSISKVLFQFPFLLIKGFFRRLIWKYFIYNVNATTVLLVLGSLLALCGGSFGLYRWIVGGSLGQFQSAGTVALALVPLISGILMLLQALLLDIMERPDMPLQSLISDYKNSDKDANGNNPAIF